MADPVTNFAKVTVSLGYSNVATSIVLIAGHGALLPAPAVDGAFNLIWWDATTYGDPADDPNVEIVRCTARTDDTLTVTRAQEGTGASTKNTADRTYKMILGFTKKTYDDIGTTYAPLASPTFTGTLTVPVALTGLLRADTGVVSVDTDVTDLVTNLPYTALANGTDGNLITWDADGKIAAVATGTATQILTSNGAGTAPTFQAPAVGSQTVNIYLGAESAYLPATNPAALSEVAGATTYAGYSELLFDDATSEHIIFRVPVPDYDGGNITVTAHGRPATTPDGAVTAILNILTIGLATSEAFNSAVTVDTTVDITFNFNTTELQTDVVVASNTIDPANVAADDILVIEFSRNVADTLAGDLTVLGFMLEYSRS
jgi:hypothetical protein